MHRYAGQPCGAEHLRTPASGCEHWPATQAEEARPQETFATIQSEAPVKELEEKPETPQIPLGYGDHVIQQSQNLASS